MQTEQTEVRTEPTEESTTNAVVVIVSMVTVVGNGHDLQAATADLAGMTTMREVQTVTDTETGRTVTQEQVATESTNVNEVEIGTADAEVTEGVVVSVALDTRSQGKLVRIPLLPTAPRDALLPRRQSERNLLPI